MMMSIRFLLIVAILNTLILITISHGNKNIIKNNDNNEDNNCTLDSNLNTTCKKLSSSSTISSISSTLSPSSTSSTSSTSRKSYKSYLSYSSSLSSSLLRDLISKKNLSSHFQKDPLHDQKKGNIIILFYFVLILILYRTF